MWLKTPYSLVNLAQATQIYVYQAEDRTYLVVAEIGTGHLRLTEKMTQEQAENALAAIWNNCPDEAACPVYIDMLRAPKGVSE